MSGKVSMQREVEVPTTRMATLRRLGRIDTIARSPGAREGCWLVRLVQAGRGASMSGDRFALFSTDSAGDDFRSLRITLARLVHNEDEFYIFDPDQMPAIGDWVWVEDR
jgi:hypothetical protein